MPDTFYPRVGITLLLDGVSYMVMAWGATGLTLLPTRHGPMLLVDRPTVATAMRENRMRLASPAVAVMSPAERQDLVRRRAYCDGFLGLEAQGEAERTSASMAEAIARLASGSMEAEVASFPRPSPSTLRRWLHRYEASGFHDLGLATRAPAVGSRLPVEVRRALTAAVRSYASQERPSMAKCYDRLQYAVLALNAARADEGLEELAVPSRSTLGRAIRSVDRRLLVAGRYGEAAARRMLRRR
ncbi:DNA-binding domain-containing protein [Methylobacterium aerolatum]|uniref:Mu DNA binding I gamma subdomain domain-containing protein n=1 Tax=Methylobacterium aerolatum TaxID=418708 RepID=A0ABU0HXN0_9HYPH|nr:DNA-binding domain-containing protein [Methylobacterium aerolatum]MDQ0447066.1 hypothetical protein [Methylobacterium aerolatum]GJD37227.1 hypothetical protein FMGBMHLM_4154 [Methylobacterium aerolatum]